MQHAKGMTESPMDVYNGLLEDRETYHSAVFDGTGV